MPSAAEVGDNTYHALQMKAEKRLSKGGTILAAYTFSKILGDVQSTTQWLDYGIVALPGIQNPGNLRAEKALAAFDARQRLVVSYSLDLPFGKGQKFLSGANSAAQKAVSGWSVSGTSTFQEGFPLGFAASPNLAGGFGLGLRPNVVPGCNLKTSGSESSRIYDWFNPACFTVPAGYTLGDESETDGRVRGSGVNNFNFSAIKRTALTERFNLEFRAEFYNLFNRVQFGPPNTTITSAANSTAGYVTTQGNLPRLVQLTLRLVF